jgi:hypothetical protein
MPDAPPPSKGFDLKKKVGPLPVWAWSLIGISGAYLGIRWYRAKKAAAASTATAVPASNSPLPYNGLGSGIGGGWGGSGGSGTPWTTTPTPEPTATPTSTLPAQTVPVAPALSAPAMTAIPTPEGMARSLQAAGVGSNLSPAQANALSVLYQPQNQPGVNPNVSSAPVTQLQEGGSVAPASGTGTRYVTPGPAPYAFTFG